VNEKQTSGKKNPEKIIPEQKFLGAKYPVGKYP
jgi:hypothetical protein